MEQGGHGQQVRRHTSKHTAAGRGLGTATGHQRSRQPGSARQDLDALLGDLDGVCGQLEELATTWRREHTSGTSRQLPLAFPHRLQGAARQLVGTLMALAEAGPEPELAASAAAELTPAPGPSNSRRSGA